MYKSLHKISSIAAGKEHSVKLSDLAN